MISNAQNNGHTLEEIQAAEAKLQELINDYKMTPKEADEAIDQRVAFLRTIKDFPQMLEKAIFSIFLAEQVQPEDFIQLEWQTPDSIALFCEILYGFRYANEDVANQVKRHVRHLLRYVLYQYEAEGNLEKVFQMIRFAPTHPMMRDIELSRLRYRAYLYEINRVKRNRRIMFGYLIIQAFLIVVVFPLLFINAENGRIQRAVENLADIELGDDGYIPYTYMQGLYWSTVTASSIGYGDLTPVTNTGRMIASVLGTMGVVTIGILAGLLLDWITPRSLE